ncbi:hypothetical protein HPSA20_1181 [Helicobacter pylori SouthAfrica20]|uniref:Uncharacterized protein n=1 Tax=Helicobacter pylori SouthAfrica20 TaxID=1352356 RepID=T1UAI6_HELPX|nr:hypothetical protein HPSA20_1181 [Helicobacter pylori SouthAfrica20]
MSYNNIFLGIFIEKWGHTHKNGDYFYGCLMGYFIYLWLFYSYLF